MHYLPASLEPNESGSGERSHVGEERAAEVQRLINGWLLIELQFPGTVYRADGARPGSVARLPDLSSALVSCTCHKL